MPTSMIEPNREFETSAHWGNRLISGYFVAVNSLELTGSILGIISKAKAIKHNFTFYNFDIRNELIGREINDYKIKVPNIPTNLDDLAKKEDGDIPVLTLIPKATPFEFKSEPSTTEVGDVTAIKSLQNIGEATAIIGKAWYFLTGKYRSEPIHKHNIFDLG
jgi:hypothetical protein